MYTEPLFLSKRTLCFDQTERPFKRYQKNYFMNTKYTAAIKQTNAAK